MEFPIRYPINGELMVIYGDFPWDFMVIFHGIYGGLMESNGIYPLVMTNIAMV